jgi:hypothetical protein
MAFGRGSTGRTALKNLKEQLAMEQATSNPTAGSPVFVKGGMKVLDGRRVMVGLR